MSEFPHLWYIRTPIEKGEIFSSWLIRSALEVGCSPLTLTELLWGKWRAFTIDLDKGIDTGKFKLLLQHCFESEQTIQQTMLTNFIHDIHPECQENQNSPWILYLGMRNRSNLSGRQICCHCLNSTDVPPYLRLIWRMGWHVGCDEHQTLLKDHCPACGVTIQPFKIDLQHGSLAICTSCGYDLRNYQQQGVDQGALNFQKNADKVLKAKSGFYNQHLVTSVEWFEVARAWLSQIRILINTKNIKIIQMFENLGINLDIPFPVTPLAFEYLNTKERETLLSILDKIMVLPCDLIVQHALEYGISSANFWDKRKKLPIQLQYMKDSMIKPARAYVAKRQISSAKKPKSKVTVQRKWLKLLRKMNQGGGKGFE